MTKIADSYFIDSDTGKKIPVRMEYSGVFKPDTTMITAHNVYRLNNGVAEKLDGSGWRQPNTDDPNYWKTNIRQAAKNQEEPLNSVKYYWNKFTNWIKEDKNGGNMNYASYLQGGGAAPLNAAPLVSKEDIAEVITAALNGTGETKQKATAALQEMMQDASLAPLVEQVMSEMGIPLLKCGGRVKKKEMGSKLVKAEKAKCGCALKKVGGRLIEVDTCTGLPIHRNGGQVKKYQNAAGAIQRADDGSYYFKDGPASRTYTAAEAKERLGAVRHNGSYYYRSPEGRIYTLESTPLNWAQSAGWAEMKKNDAGAYVLHPDVLAGLGYQKRENGSWGYGPAPETTPQSPAPLPPQAPAAPAGQLPPAAPAPAAPSSPASPAPSSAGPGLFTGDLRSYGARRQWVTDNAEYLKSQGWDDARIAGYKGSAADNIALQKAISGKSAWDAEQRAADQLRQQKFVEEIAPSHPLEKAAIIPPKTSAIVKTQGLLPTAELIKSNILTAMLGQNTSDRRMAKYDKAYDFIKTGANAANMSAADTRRANRLATKMRKAGLRENGGQLNYDNYLN